MGILLATLSALVFGCADFMGGKATRTASSATVAFVSQRSGLLVLAVGLLVSPGSGPTLRTTAFGAIGGLFGGLGILLLYHGLSTGSMSIISPLSAVTSASVPVIVGIALLGERPLRNAIIGIVFALVAIALVSSSRGPMRAGSSLARSVGIAVGSGLGFGLFFVFLQKAGDPKTVGLWGLVAARPASIGLAALVAKRNQVPLKLEPKTRRLAVSAGVLDQLANVLYVLSIGRGLLSLLALLASLYPVSTVALAYIVDHERLNRPQKIGLVLALLGTVLIATSA